MKRDQPVDVLFGTSLTDTWIDAEIDIEALLAYTVCRIHGTCHIIVVGLMFGTVIKSPDLDFPAVNPQGFCEQNVEKIVMLFSGNAVCL